MPKPNRTWIGALGAICILLLLLHAPLGEALARNRGFLELTSLVLPTPSLLTPSEHDSILVSFKAGGVDQALGAGMLELFLGHCSPAMPHLQAYLAGHPADEFASYWIGQCYSESGDWQSAIRVWQDARLIRPLQDAGNLLADRQKWQLASQAYQAVVTLTPNDCEYQAHAISATWWATLDARSAIDKLRSMIANCPNDDEGYLVLGRILIETGQFSGAESNFTKARELAPNSDTPLLNLALLRLRQQRVQDAIDFLNSALDTNPNRAETFALLGTADFAHGETHQAIQDYQTAIRLDPNQAWVYEALGAAYEADGAKDNARTAYQHALDLDPNRVGARTRLAKMTSSK